MNESYQVLAQRLNDLPNGFPPTEDGSELRLLAKLFTPEEAALAAQLRLTKETIPDIAARLGGDPQFIRKQLKSLTRRGLIAAGKIEGGLGYGLLPFVVGIYEMQVGRMDGELAQLFETYYQQAFGQMLAVQPSVHRVIPVNESVRLDMEIRPYESATQIVNNARAWGVVDCICRTQKLLIGQPCMHPMDVCMVLSQAPHAFDNSPVIHSLSQEEAIDTLDRAARAGLVHSVSNNQDGLWYICNCCTCSCGILRGMADLGIANVVARSAYMSHLADEALCTGCGSCLDFCQFDAISLDHFIAKVNQTRCVGCGLCIQSCPSEALALIARPADQVKPVPKTEMDWLADRAAARGLSLEKIL